MTKEERQRYNREYYKSNRERIKKYKAKRYKEDKDYRINLKLSANKRKK